MFIVVTAARNPLEVLWRTIQDERTSIVDQEGDGGDATAFSNKNAGNEIQHNSRIDTSRCISKGKRCFRQVIHVRSCSVVARNEVRLEVRALSIYIERLTKFCPARRYPVVWTLLGFRTIAVGPTTHIIQLSFL